MFSMARLDRHLSAALWKGSTEPMCECANSLARLNPEVRHARLVGPRGQPELSNSQMDCWAAYLRGQADALNLPVIDTTDLGIDAAVDALVPYVQQVKADRAAAEQQA